MQKNNGFTLIEVLAALIIVALGMLAVIRAVNLTVSNTNYLREKTIAHWVAMNKLAETRLNPVAPSDGDSDGDVDMAGVTWHWRMNITKTDNYIQRIEVKVAPKTAKPDSSMDTVFGLYGKSFAPSTLTNWDFNPGGINPNGTNTNNGQSSSASSNPDPRPGPLQ